ncbi:hypothetical protein BG011_005689 [Mortierella polycephala]|uniref:Uncharacterized protein n=1 Tax=Mortierella polycephala TaxID=41804 RepID=A0A9P6QFD0_9FUNG|nr:hypothetical protein BG011_005689 [Mortierella polycephala]
MSRGASSPVLIAPCSLSRATLFRMEYEILWFGLGIGATILHLRGLSRQWTLRHRVQSMHAGLERARQIKQAIKSLAQQGDDIPDTLQDVLVRARQEARGMIDQAGGDVSPELQKAADDIYSELTEAMSFVLMVNESKAKQSIGRETTLG